MCGNVSCVEVKWVVESDGDRVIDGGTWKRREGQRVDWGRLAFVPGLDGSTYPRYTRSAIGPISMPRLNHQSPDHFSIVTTLPTLHSDLAITRRQKCIRVQLY